jgi:carbohydrate kinase (thermoresistant glucokinase family)
MGKVILIGGVAGSGKSTLGKRLAQRLGWRFMEGDDFHPPCNVEKMRRGSPLSDADREPWIDAIADALRSADDAGESVILACSALKRAHRDRLRTAGREVFTVLLAVDRATLQHRLASRSGHFFGPELLESQFLALEPLSPDEAGITVDGNLPWDTVIAEILARHDLSQRT